MRNRFTVLFAALCLMLIACGQQSPTVGANQSTERHASGSSSRVEPPVTEHPHDLQQDESLGGHTLKRHVGLSDQQLRQRLDTDSGIGAASTYTDREVAESIIGAALFQDRDKVDRWLNRNGRHPNLVLDYDSPRPIGRTLYRGVQRAQSCAHALIVLKWDSPDRYHVLTSYPECR